MLRRDIVNKVIKRVRAAEDPKPGDVLPGKDPSPQAVETPTNRKRYYFFLTPTDNSIPFTSLSKALNESSENKERFIENLKGGNSGPMKADYFQWKKVIVRSTEYSKDRKSYVVYTCDLSIIGEKIPNSVKIYPEEYQAFRDKIEADFELFKSNSSMLNVSPNFATQSEYFAEEPAANIVKIALSGQPLPGNSLDYANFTHTFDQYRVWDISNKALMLPDMTVPKTDGVPGGHYKGGQEAYNQIVKPIADKLKLEKQTKQQEPQEPSLGERVDQQKKPSTFEPVDEQSQEPVKGDVVDKTASEKKRKKGDFSSEPYSGGTNVMQELVKDQRTCMNIRRASMKVISMYQTVQPATSRTTTSPGQKGVSIQLTEDPKENEQTAKKVDEYAKKQKELQNKMKSQMRSQGVTPTTPTPPTGKYASDIPLSTVERVVGLFLE